MEINVSKEDIGINKLICEKKELVFINDDIIVPDTKPDIINIINANGNICILKKEIQENKIKVEGSINTYVMYMPDSNSDKLRALNCVIDFSQTINIQGINEQMQINLKPMIKDIECKILNGRKINVKVGIEFFVKVYSNEKIQIVKKINNVPSIQTLPQDFYIDSLVGTGRTVVYAKDTLNLDAQDEIAEVLKLGVLFLNQDYKISYNKVLTKSELSVNILYLTEDGKIKKVNGNIPVVGFIDIQNIDEKDICDINYEIKNMKIKPNPAEEHSIYVEFEIEVNLVVYEEKQINLIQDLYSPVINLEYATKKILTSSKKMVKNSTFTIKEKTEVLGVDEENLIDVDTLYSISNTKITSNKIFYSGEIILNFIYSNSNNITSKLSKIPFEVSTENELEDENININTNLMIKDTNLNVKKAGEIDCTIDMEINTKMSKNCNISLIDNIKNIEKEKNKDDYDSLILYIVKQKDTIWNIAKKYNSTVEQISMINGIEDTNKINIGQRIYIPKFNYVNEEIKN